MMDSSNSSLITDTALSCSKQFDRINSQLKLFENLERRLKLELGISPEEVEDASGKFHILIGNTSALARGRISLDDYPILEDVRQKVLKLLQQLKSSLSNRKYQMIN
jgi:hypothetical protein